MCGNGSNKLISFKEKNENSFENLFLMTHKRNN